MARRPDAKCSADIAEKAVDATRDIAQRELCAYVFAETAKYEDIDLPTQVFVKLRRTDQTPAYRLKPWIVIKFTEEIPPLFIQITSEAQESKLPKFDIGPGATRNTKYTYIAHYADEYLGRL